MKTAIVIGRSGQVANELIQTAPKNFNVTALGRNEIDITDIASIETAIENHAPNAIINASAYTAVDNAESDSQNAYLINNEAVKYLAIACKKYNVKLLHVSTDFVFNGESSTAYTVNDNTDAKSVYGASKLAGEQSIQEIYPEGSKIVRTSWVYSSFGNNFVKTMLRLMAEKEELNIVNDQIGCPTYAKGLAEFLWCLAESPDAQLMYHWSDAGVASWYDFAVAIQKLGVEAKLLDKKIPLKGIPSSAYPTPAKRPKFSLLNTMHSLSIKQPKHWSENLEVCISTMSSEG
jgi:dTDP-4-dehydrorhamnose reductase